MLKLSTHLTLDIIEKSKKLQGVRCEKLHYMNAGKWTGSYVDAEYYKEVNDAFRKDKLIPAPTIADIIDNASELFGKSGNEKADLCKVFLVRNAIFNRLLHNKPLKDIEEYILNNLK